MTGYCKLCGLRITASALNGGAPNQHGYLALCGQMLTHLQQHHAGAFDVLLLKTVEFQSIIAGYLLNPPPSCPTDQTVDPSEDLVAERARRKALLSETLSLENPCEVREVSPAMKI